MNVLSSLTNRIFLASALLVVASIGVAIYRVDASVAAEADADLRSGLAEGASLVDEFTRTEFRDFVVKAQLIADLPVLNNATATTDAPTVEPIAREYQTTIGADIFVVIGKGDRILAEAGRVALGDDAIRAILAGCRGSRDGTFFWPIDGGLLHAAAIPMDASLGTLIVGASLDHELAARIKAATNSDVAFVRGARIVASSLDAATTAALASVAGRRDEFTVPIGSEVYSGRVQPLGSADDGDAPVALVLQSQTDRLRFLSQLRWQIAVTALAAVLVATVAGYLVARTVTRPLRALTGTMADMAATGDLTRALPALGRWDDEDVRLVATTFHQLTSALDRIQREASLRDRLSSLGRLSTVVAHEIRNPLMIIKTAVRGLKRHDAADIAALASSIDEEVGRLNRVVAGVLDFAKPIQFELAPADLGDVCRAAADAARAASGEPAIDVRTSGPARVVTDAERLRSVLVNLLTNAQQAVLSAGSPATAPIEVRLSRRSADVWLVEVRDRGTGIDPHDLPRIFDPFFTTRRGGSGLGLAIARNIIEGLGGTIAVESRLGAGSVVFIELPDRRSGREERA